MAETALGDIYKIMLKALDKICNEHKYIANIVKNSKKLKEPCTFPARLQIKCSDKSSCLCESKKNKHYMRIPKLQASSPTKGLMKPNPKKDPDRNKIKAYDRLKKVTSKSFQDHIRPVINHPKSIKVRCNQSQTT